MTQKATDVDSLLDALGPVSRYEVLQLTVFSLGLLPCAFQLFAIVFVGQDVTYHCAPGHHAPYNVVIANGYYDAAEALDTWTSPLNVTNTAMFYGTCSIYHRVITANGSTTDSRPCVHGYNYEDATVSSLVSEFDLVCDKAPLVGLTQTLLSVGQVVGSFILPAMADRWGRKLMHVIAHVLMVASGIGMALAPNFATFAVMKVVVGIGQIGARLTHMTATVELFPARHRARVSAVYNGIVWAIIMALIAPLAYCLRFQSWRVLQLLLTSASLLGLIQLLLLDEPLRWLLANNKQKQAVAIIRKAARWNSRNADILEDQVLSLLSAFSAGKQPLIASVTQVDRSPCPTDNFSDAPRGVALTELKEQNPFKLAVGSKMTGITGAKKQTSSAKRITALGLLKHRRMRAHVFIACCLWFVNTLTYFALILASSSLVGNKYVNFALVSLVEIPSCIAYSFTLDRFGRKPTLITFHMLAGLGLISSSVCLAFSETHIIATLSTVLSLVGKFAITGSLNVVFTYTTELFPTNCRNMSLGAASSAGRIGAMLAPFAGLLGQYLIWAPGCVFGTLCLLTGFLVMMVPETKGRPLPQTVEDLERW